MPFKQRVLSASRALGVEPGVRRLQQLVEPAVGQRNRIDDEHLRVLMGAVLRRDSNAVDVGANVGSVLEALCELAPAGRHVAVEPLADLAEALQARFPQVSVRRCALSTERGERGFVRDLGAPSRSGFRSQAGDAGAGQATVTVPVSTLDDVVGPDREVAFVKLDVEGAEGEVLRGGLETLRRCRPVVAFEHGASAVRHYGTSHREVHHLLTDLAGLSIFDMDGRGPFSADEFDLIADPPGTRWNFFARPW